MSLFAARPPLPDHSETLREIDQRLHSVESSIKQLQLEWDETFDKIRRLTSRLAKRDAVDARTETPPNGADETIEGAAGLDPISAKIMSRRSFGR